MGYLQEFQEELRKMLGDLDEAKQKEIARFVGAKVLESYRNGQENGKAAAKLDRLSNGLKQAGKRFFSAKGGSASGGKKPSTED